MSRRLSSAALLLAALTLAPRARAADPEQVYQAAVAAMKGGKLAEACPMFAEARRLKPDSTGALQGLAICFDKLGKTASAWTKYRELSVELKAGGDSARAQAAADRAAELAKGLSTVTVKPDGPDTPGLVIRLDGDDVPRVLLGAAMNVDPGPHAVEATAPGYEVWKTSFVITPGSAPRVISIPALDKARTAPTSDAGGAPAFSWTPRRAVGIGVAGVGVAGVVVGAIFGAKALSQNASSKTQCQPQNPDACSPSGVSQYHDALTSAHVSTAALVAGGVAVAAGLAVFLTAPSVNKTAASARVEALPLVGAGMGGLALRVTW